MKILIISSNQAAANSHEMFYKNSFEALGHTVLMVACRNALSLYEKVAIRVARLSYRGMPPKMGAEDILPKLGDYKPDLSIIFRGEDLKPCAVSALRQISPYGCVNIYSDSPFVIPGYGASQLLPTFNEYTRFYVASRHAIPTFEQLGAKEVKVLTFGYAKNFHALSKTHYPGALARIGYLGSWGPLQEAWLEPLNQFGLNIYGGGWKHLRKDSPLRMDYRPGQGIGEAMKQAISCVDIVFNMVRAEHGCAISMKTFEIPACGGFMLTNWTEDQAEFFEDGKDCVFFHTQEELLDKVKFYLKHESTRKKIQEAGYAAVRPHSYDNRAQAMLGDILKQ